jgi:hypothetical protein
MVSQVGRCLHQEVVSAVVAPRAGEAVGKDAAPEVFGKRLAHVGLGAVVVGPSRAHAGQFKPGLVTLVQQRAFAVAWIEEFGFG